MIAETPAHSLSHLLVKYNPEWKHLGLEYRCYRVTDYYDQMRTQEQKDILETETYYVCASDELLTTQARLSD